MTVAVYVGTQGSGMSLSSVRASLDSLKQGVKTYSNYKVRIALPLEGDQCRLPHLKGRLARVKA